VLLHLAALDARIKRLVLEDTLVSYEAVVRRPIHRQAFESAVPGVLRSYDLPDLVAALAPRPVWIVNPVDPTAHLLPLEEAARASDATRPIYQTLGAAPSLRVIARKPGAKPTVW